MHIQYNCLFMVELYEFVDIVIVDCGLIVKYITILRFFLDLLQIRRICVFRKLVRGN